MSKSKRQHISMLEVYVVGIGVLVTAGLAALVLWFPTDATCACQVLP